MLLADYHTHSLCSPDGTASILDMALAGQAAGLSGLCVTDHCDLLTFRGEPDRSFCWAPVEDALALARAQLGNAFPIRMGLELGEAWEAPDFSQALTAHPELDFVLGSVHNISAARGGEDFYFRRYQTDADCYAALDDYFDSMERLAALRCYDVLAHIIYPLRYMNGRDGNHVTLERYREPLHRIFRMVVDSGRGIEVNTCRGRSIEDWRPVLALYQDCGGTLLTLGSDAHQPDDVGKGLPQAAKLVREMGFPGLTVYEKHRPRLIEWGKEDKP